MTTAADLPSSEKFIGSVIEGSRELLEKAELDFNIPQGYLPTQIALHLPQFQMTDIIKNGTVNRALLLSECLRLGTRLESGFLTLPPEFQKLVLAKTRETKVVRRYPQISQLTINGQLTNLSFGTVDSPTGFAIQKILHYLANPRRDTLYHFGLFVKDSSFPLAYVAFSPLDRRYIQQSLPFDTNEGEVLVLTRAYNINSSPFNAMSFLISQAIKQVKINQKNLKAVVTAVNPNVLFRGTIFKAAAFKPFALVPFVPQYYKGNYVTRKTLSQLSPAEINKGLIETAKFPLTPLIWTVRVLDRRLAKSFSRPLIRVSYETYSEG
ncbi:MAG: hypothetical protein M1352_00530 [Patescibacteria group bacterium]|nr:hypothetical protein [Patescibacteria group bacterium]